MTAANLPQFILGMIAAGCPDKDIHKWLFNMGRVLHPYWPDNEIVDYLWNATRGARREVPLREILDAVRDSAEAAWVPGERIVERRQPRWPALDKEKREAIIAWADIELADLWEMSPWREQNCEDIIDILFPGNPLLCVGIKNEVFDSNPREWWRGKMAKNQFITPSPMIAKAALTKTGKMSSHALSAVGPRRFIVVEFDTGSADDHACLLRYLYDKAPLVMAVHSGNKSLHGWFYCQGQEEETTLLGFMREAVSLGADSVMWGKSQFARMPEGIRQDGKPQHVFYFDPEAVQ